MVNKWNSFLFILHKLRSILREDVTCLFEHTLAQIFVIYY